MNNYHIRINYRHEPLGAFLFIFASGVPRIWAVFAGAPLAFNQFVYYIWAIFFVRNIRLGRVYHVHEWIWWYFRKILLFLHLYRAWLILGAFQYKMQVCPKYGLWQIGEMNWQQICAVPIEYLDLFHCFWQNHEWKWWKMLKGQIREIQSVWLFSWNMSKGH